MRTIAPDYDPTTTHDLSSLRYVRAIAAHGSITAAARELRISQPSLSVAISTLEERLGTTLFLRGARGVVPTASGLAVVRAGEAIVAVLRQLDDELHGIESAHTGRFIVGCYHSFGAFFLPELMRALAARAPAIELVLWEGTGPEVRDALLDRTLHFAIVAGVEGGPHPDLVIVPMFRDVMGVVTARKRPPDSSPLFHVPRIPSSQRVLEALRRRGALPPRVVPCGDLELVKSLVLHGAGIGIMPWRVACYGTARAALRWLDPSLPFEVDIGTLLYRADLHRTRGALLVRDELAARGAVLDASGLPVKVPPLVRRRR